MLNGTDVLNLTETHCRDAINRVSTEDKCNHDSLMQRRKMLRLYSLALIYSEYAEWD